MAEINFLSPLFAFMLKCHEQLGFRLKFECSSETRLPGLDFSWNFLFFCLQLQSGPQVCACLFPLSLLQISYLMWAGEVMLFRKHLQRLLETGRADGRERQQVFDPEVFFWEFCLRIYRKKTEIWFLWRFRCTSQSTSSAQRISK